MVERTIRSRQNYAFAVCRNGARLERTRFETVGEAGEEAERQSARNPGRRYIVLKEIARVITQPDPAAKPPHAAGGAGRQRPPSPGSKGRGR